VDGLSGLLRNFVASIVYLVNRSRRADAFAVSTAEIGVVFCTVVLITGPLWARPVWGIWWTWDARLTSTLILWLIYVSYLILRRFSTGGQTPVLAAALAVFGFIDVPIVYLSIRYFRTQHPQPVVGGGEGSGIDPVMLKTLLMNWLAFMVFAGIVLALRYRLERLRQQVEEAQAQREEAEAEPPTLRDATTGRASR
jgi:heme exporter protein C